MAYSINTPSKKKVNLLELSKNKEQNPTNTPNPDATAFGHIFKRGWNYLSFPKWMQYTKFEDIFALQYDITKIKTLTSAIVRSGNTNSWVGSSDILSVDPSQGYMIYNEGDEELQLAYLGYPLFNDQLNWKFPNKISFNSVPINNQVSKIEDALAFDNANAKLRSSGTGSASATTALTVADGDATVSGIAEKQFLTLSAYTQAISTANGKEIIETKKYVIVDSSQAGAVATGTVLVEGSDTGAGTISASSHLINGIAVSVNLSSANYGTLINELRTAILHANGHNGKITCGDAVTPADGTQSIALTQAVKGTRGNLGVSNSIANLTVDHFTGGMYGTGVLISGITGEAQASAWVNGSFQGSLDLKPSTSIVIKFNDKPESDRFRVFRDQGPDLGNDPLYADGRPPYGTSSPTFSDYPVHLENWGDLVEGWSYYVQGHWSYYNDGEPDEDYPYTPNDSEWGTYRVWIDSDEWVGFSLANPELHHNLGLGFAPFGYHVNIGQNYFMYGTGHPPEGQVLENISATTTVDIDLDSIKSGQRTRLSGFGNFENATAENVVVLAYTASSYWMETYGYVQGYHRPYNSSFLELPGLGDVTSVASVRLRTVLETEKWDLTKGTYTSLTEDTHYELANVRNPDDLSIDIRVIQNLARPANTVHQLEVTYNYDDAYSFVRKYPSFTDPQWADNAENLFQGSPQITSHISMPHSGGEYVGSHFYVEVESVTFNGSALTKDVDYEIKGNNDHSIKFIKNIGSGVGTLAINYIWSMDFNSFANPNHQLVGIDGNPLEAYYDALGVFKSNQCVGSACIGSSLTHVDTIPIMMTQSIWYDHFGDTDWYLYTTGSYGVSAGVYSTVSISSSVVDGSNIPSDSSVYVKLSSFNNQVTKYFVFSDYTGAGPGQTYNVNATGDRASIFTNFKSAIEDAFQDAISVDVATATITLTQAVQGPEGNTPVIFGGDGVNALSDTVTVTGTFDEMFEAEIYDIPPTGSFQGGGTADVPKWVCWDASKQKYYVMKWHHKNITTGVETKYEYWEMQEKLHDGTLPDMTSIFTTNISTQTYNFIYKASGSFGLFGTANMPIEVNSLNDIHIYVPHIEDNYWFLKAVEETW